MSLDRIRSLCERFRHEIGAAVTRVPDAPACTLSADLARDLLESMLLARHLDLAAHELRAQGAGHYTICSTGHESNVVLGRLTRPTDPTLLHYRSAAVQVERARQRPTIDPVRDIALSLCASSEEPASGGRHKVLGHPDLGIIPQTSTIASHLPRAVGLAFALEVRRQLGRLDPYPDDSIVLASFGDASVNHSSAAGAFNAAGWVAHQNLKLPLVLVCEDNGLGISVRTPPGWIEERLRALPHFLYVGADGEDIGATWTAAETAIRHARIRRRPAVLHLRTVRLLGHAGNDVDTVYRGRAELHEAERRDPVLSAALSLIASGVLGVDDVLALERAAAERVAAEAARAATRPKLTTRAEVVSEIARPASGTAGHDPAPPFPTPGRERLTLAQGINTVLAETLERIPEALVFGEDVARKGGVYGVTKGLFARFGPVRVFNTLLDETTILGMALGAGTLGMLPLPEIQYLAYLHNAEDQLRGEAATMAFFSRSAYRNPMVVRIQGLAYQKGFGGHFHNDNSLGVLRDVPGLSVAVPARADDAIEIFRTAVSLARDAGRVVVIVEPIALYHTKDLYETGDNLWLAQTPAGAAPFRRVRRYDPPALAGPAPLASRDAPGAASFEPALAPRATGPGTEPADLTIATYGNGVAMSLRATRRLARAGLRARVLDLRFLVPLPADDVIEDARGTGRLLVVDECRQSGNVSEGLAAAVLDAGLAVRFARVTSADSFIPLGAAADLVLLSEEEIVAAAQRLCAQPVPLAGRAAIRAPSPRTGESARADRSGRATGR